MSNWLCTQKVCFNDQTLVMGVYLILLWGDVTRPGQVKLGSQLYSDHFGYTITMIAFYFMPLLLFKGKNLLNLINENIYYKINS